MQDFIQISTPAHNGLYDITRQVEAIVSKSGIQSGLVNVYVQGATAGIMIPAVAPWTYTFTSPVLILLSDTMTSTFRVISYSPLFERVLISIVRCI